ncbi:MAG: alpha/beta hydrolase [Treponema sp.]|jgi:acetyl esterase|nr:alpha/beta hydrolase [Treponema sp.]
MSKKLRSCLAIAIIAIIGFVITACNNGMTKEKADRKNKRTQAMIKITVKKQTIAQERYIDTSYGKIRVLEYGFDSPEIKPLYIDLHGGGFALMFPEYNEKQTVYIQNETKIKVISIDYPKAPQNPYPAAVEAIYEVVKHYVENASTYKIDPESIGIGGYSAGGNLATVTCIKANEKKEFQIKFQIMCYPPTDLLEDPFMKLKNKKAPKAIFQKDVQIATFSYLSDFQQSREPYCSPVYATKEQLNGLPPALLIVAGIDPLYPEGLRYGKKLEEAGVPLDLHEFKESVHGFTHYGKHDAKEAMELIVWYIKNHL